MPHASVTFYPAGEGWIGDLLGWFPAAQWMQIAPRASSLQDATNLPTVIPPDIAAAEECFRRPDGWIVCTVPGIWADSYRNQGFPQVPQSAPDFIPPPTVAGTGYEPPPVVSSDPSEGVSENASTVAIEWGTVFQSGIDLFNTWGQSSATSGFGGPIQPIPQPIASPAMTPGGSCGCNSNPCVCGTINGRPALVDPRTGKRCYRRRRRVMLTEGDFNTLLRIATLPNNANVRTALAKAIGRR